MSQQQIRTRIHQVREMLGSAALGGTPVRVAHSETWGYDHSANEEQTEVLLAGIELLEKTPKFWVEEALMELIHERGDVAASLTALHRAGVARLPFPNMVVEFELGGDHLMVVLSERSPSLFVDDPGGPHPFRAMVWRISDKQLVLSPSVIHMQFQEDLGGDNGGGYHLIGHSAPYLPDEDMLGPGIQASLQIEGAVAGMALSSMLLLLNTRGVHKEVIEPTRLNKKRVQHGHEPIPTHTVIRIGHIYRRDGTSFQVGERKTPRIHWRRAHTREQRIGKGRTERKLVYIAPMLINYQEGQIPAVPEARVHW